MVTANSIVITKEANGNVLVTPEGTPYTIDASSKITKQESSVLVKERISGAAVVEFTVAAVEKVVSNIGGEVLISDVDTLFDELNNYFFFDLSTSGLTSVTKTFSKAEVLTFNTANGGYGHEILPKPGVGKYYQIKNVVFIFDLEDGGTDPANLEIYANSSPSKYIITLSGYSTIGVSKRLYEPVMIARNNDNLTSDEEVWIWATVEQANADGTATLTFDYKLIDTTL